MNGLVGQLQQDNREIVERIYTIGEATQDFFQGKVSAWLVGEAVRRKELPSVKLGRRVLLRESALLQWWAEKEAASIAEPRKAGR